MGKYSGSNFQLPVGGYLPSSKNVQSGLGTDFNAANQLWGISQPTPIKNKKGKVTGERWNPLALQSQLGQYKGDVNQATNEINAFSPNAMAAAQQAEAMGLTAADMASGAVPGLFNLGGLSLHQGQDVMASQLAQIPGLQGYANEALQQGFDPQNALFNRTAQQMRDVLGASGQAAGVGGSPYGANLQSQGMENFLLDWQNQQLGREQTAAGTAGSLYNTISGLPAAGESLYNIGEGLDTTALNLGQGATSLASAAGNLPIQEAQGIAQGKLGLQDALTQAKSNMYNQRTGGFNAMNQYLSTVDNFLKTAVGAQAQNLGASQTGLNDMLSFAALPLQMLGK